MVTLKPISRIEYSEFIRAILGPYAEERSAADGVSLAAAERHARDQMDRLLPDGYDTDGHHFLRIVPRDGGPGAGSVWLHIDRRERAAFLYYITVLPECRRRGYASAAMGCVEDLARREGCARLALNVFAANAGAIALYRKLGFDVASMHMNKRL